MAKKSRRQFLLLECTACKSRNYTTKKNMDNSPDKLSFKKYCKFCKKSIDHKEVKIN